jgi:SdpI/YfhL protein family
VRRGLEKKSAGHLIRVTPLAGALRSGSPTLVSVPLPLRLVLGSLLVLAGVALLAIAVLGLRRRLPRNRWVGVRTAATLRSNAAFAVANQVAAAPLGAAGAVAAAGGVALLAGADGTLAWALLAVSAAGATVLAGVGGVAGDRAASAVQPAPLEPSACAGSCAGCDLVAGCRDAVAGVTAASERA